MHVLRKASVSLFGAAVTLSSLLVMAGSAAAASNCAPGLVPCTTAWLANFTDQAPVYGSGDFNGDGSDDLLVIENGALWLWYGAPNHVPTMVALAQVRVVRAGQMQQSLAGTEPVIGDFDGDGRADVLWAAQNGAPADNGQIWFGTATVGEFNGAPAAGTAHDPAAYWTVGDYDGDGGDDVLWYRDNTGALQLELLAGDQQGLQGVNYPDQLDRSLRLVRGDLDGNRTDDVLFYDQRSGLGSVWYFGVGGGIDARVVQPGAGFRLNVGDFDGDGVRDLLWYGPGDQVDAYWFGTRDRTFRPGPLAAPVGGSVFPMVADFDGDGRSDVLWWDGGAEPDNLWLTRDGGPYVIVEAIGGVSQLVLCDFDGDGAADPFFAGMRDLSGAPTNWALWWFSSTAR